MKRWLASEGADGEAPHWWATIQAAKYLNSTPWELEAQRPFWRHAALAAMSAENDPMVQKAREAMARMRAKAARIRQQGSDAY